MQNNELKQPKKIDELLEIWKIKGLEIEDENESLKFIKSNNYYRLSGYAKLFYNDTKKFKEGTKFKDIYNLYRFNSELRRIVMNLTEEVEILFRSYIAHYIAHNFGVEGHLNKDNFKDEELHNKFTSELRNKITMYRNKPSIKHHSLKYNGKIPVWVMVEILSFTNLSYLYSNMKNTDRKKIITENYTDDEVVKNAIEVKNWIRIICDVRNMCAHYENLIGSKLKNRLKMPTKYSSKCTNDSMYALFFILKILINDQNKWNRFIDQLEVIADKFEFNNWALLGFKENWKEELTK